MDRPSRNLGSETSRFSREQTRDFIRQRNRNQAARLHGPGGEYATSMSEQQPDYSVPSPAFFPDLFPQHPQGLALRESHEEKQAGPSSSSTFGTHFDFGGLNMAYPSEPHSSLHNYHVAPTHNPYEQAQYPQQEQQHDTQEAPGNAEQNEPPTATPFVRNRRTNYELADADVLIWDLRSSRVQRHLTEIVSQRRGIFSSDSQAVLRAHLTGRLEEDILQRNQRRGLPPNYDLIDRAITALFPITQDTLLPVWMQYMTPEESIRFVERMVEVTGVRKDYIRATFLINQLAPDVAKVYFNADDNQAYVDLARKQGILPSDYDVTAALGQNIERVQEPAWMRLLSPNQKTRAVKYIMTTKGNYPDFPSACNDMDLSHLPDDFDEMLATAKNREFLKLLHFLVHGVFPDKQ
ncbi:hypothetical protein CBS101457_000274 [Exobasidium rhododendri]|nr:hypothetical protein CBS101457_000274 [Exobasidium rhododendri]